MVKTPRLRLAGHMQRQPEERPANVAMNWLLEDGIAKQNVYWSRASVCLALHFCTTAHTPE